MNPTKLHIASSTTIQTRLAELAADPDHAWRVTAFTATVGETGSPVIALQVERFPNAAHENRIKGGKVVVVEADKAADKIVQFAQDQEQNWKLLGTQLLHLPGKKVKGAPADEPAPLTLHAVMIFLA